MNEPAAPPPSATRMQRRADLTALPAASLVAIPVRKPRPAAAPIDPGPIGSGSAHPGQSNTAQPGIAAPPAVDPTAVPVAGDPASLFAWWQRLKRGGAYPSPADLDPKAIGAAWPEAVLLNYDKSRQDIARASRLGSADNLTIEYTPMVTEWLLALGRKAARDGAPLHETRNFAGARGVTAYNLTALPLSADQHGADHVLCRLARA